jgi:hypothetical protein
MKELHYQHDMMHCSQEQCPKKNKCYRYWLALNAASHGFTTYSAYLPDEHDVLANCRYYLNIKDY